MAYGGRSGELVNLMGAEVDTMQMKVLLQSYGFYLTVYEPPNWSSWNNVKADVKQAANALHGSTFCIVESG